MRGCLALAVVAAMGCQTTQAPVNRESRAQLPGSGYVTLVRLADDLDLDYHGEGGGYIELSAPPDNVMLVHDSRRALVNGEPVSMRQPCMLRGAEFILSSEDAAALRRTLGALRTRRRKPEPLPAWKLPQPPPTRGLPAAWRPPKGVRVRDWRYIVIHHMVAAQGSAAVIHRMHKQRGWEGLGYHFVIGNGSLTADGLVEVGYRWTQQAKGAHARARPGDDNRWNLHGIGICLVGDFTRTAPTRRQQESLVRLVRALRAAYGIPVENVVPHRFIRPTVCPGPRFPWQEFRARIR
ncbi:MAG: peptidoglycan recognition protein family protein [Planctomycetota bacterium]|jgi:hypothetical protein